MVAATKQGPSRAVATGRSLLCPDIAWQGHFCLQERTYALWCPLPQGAGALVATKNNFKTIAKAKEWVLDFAKKIWRDESGAVQLFPVERIKLDRIHSCLAGQRFARFFGFVRAAVRLGNKRLWRARILARARGVRTLTSPI